MTLSKNNPSRRTMVFRYTCLTLLTIYIISMIIFVFLIVGVGEGNPGMRLDKDGVGISDVWQLARAKGSFTITQVDSAGLAAKAGLRVGDQIIAVNDVEIKEDPTAYDYGLVRCKMQLRVERNGHTEDVALIMEKHHWDLGIIFVPLLFVIGALIGWLRPGESVAFDSAVFFLFFAISFCDSFFKYLPEWGLLIGKVYSIASDVLLLPMGVRVFSVFPNPSRLGRFLWKRQWIFFLLSGLLVINDHIRLIELIFIGDIIWVVVVCVLGIALYISQRKETRDSPQTRIKVIEFGVLTSVIALVISLVGIANFFIFGISISNDSGAIVKIMFGAVLLGGMVALFAIPISFAYALLASKIFGIKFFLRKGLQYLLLSKGALFIEGVIIFLILYQIISHGGTALASSPMLVSGISFGLGILGVFTLNRVNRKLMPVIDRRFFREALDVRKLLMDLNEQLSELREREKILQLTASTVLKALHPLRVMFLLKEEKAKDFKCVLVQEHEAKQVPHPTVILKSIAPETDSSSRPEEIGTELRVTYGLTSDDTIIHQLEQKKSYVTIYPEKLDPEVEGDKRLLDLDCELLIAIQGSAGLVGIMALGGKLSEEPFSKEDRDLLTTVARQMGLSLENAELLEVAKREAEQSRDLEIARSVQQNLFPKQLPVVAGWEFAGICKPAKAVGGDYYDIFEVGTGKVVIALGDVSGKGLGASFLMSSVHATIRTRAESCIDEPLKLINELNQYLVSSTSASTFVTLFLGVIDLQSGLLRYVNCGHPPALIVRHEGAEIQKLIRTGLGLGMMKSATFTQGEVKLNAQDSLVVYSDGITEAMNEKNEEYEEEKLIILLNESKELDGSNMMEAILKSVSEFIGLAEQSDDISIIVARRKLEKG